LLNCNTIKKMLNLRLGSILAAAVVALLAGTAQVQAIYPDDHWSYSAQLTEENFESTIQKEIDAGKTMFVRWIASSG
jgi:hypothetical protein